jgi:hypothetical protein
MGEDATLHRRRGRKAAGAWEGAAHAIHEPSGASFKTEADIVRIDLEKEPSP